MPAMDLISLYDTFSSVREEKETRLGNSFSWFEDTSNLESDRGIEELSEELIVVKFVFARDL